MAVAARTHERHFEPSLEFSFARAADAVDDLVGPALLLDLTLADKAVADEPFEHLVEVADVEVTPLRPDELLELRAPSS